MVFSADLTSYGDSYKWLNQGADALNGRRYYRISGAGILTNALQTEIQLKTYPAYPVASRDLYPAMPITLPLGAEVLSASLRLPNKKLNTGDMFVWGRNVSDATTIIGTTGEILKVSFTGASTYTQFAAAKTASVVSANSVYTLGSSNRIARKEASADDASGILNTLAAPSTLNIVVSNAGSTAAGTGISLSAGSDTNALIIADIVFALVDNAVHWRDIPGMGKKGVFIN